MLKFQERVRANPCEPPESHHWLYRMSTLKVKFLQRIMYFFYKNCNKILFTFLNFYFLLIKQVSRKTTEMLSSLFGRALSTSGQTQTVTPLLTLVAVLPGSDAGFIC